MSHIRKRGSIAQVTYFLEGFIDPYYMASITSGEMAHCDWLRSTFSGPLFSAALRYVKTNACILKQNSKTN